MSRTEFPSAGGLRHQTGHTLVGGIGYRYLRDHSASMLALDRLSTETWPEGVVVEDLSFGPIALVPRLEEGGFRRVILLGVVSRPGRPPGALAAYAWDGALPAPEIIQTAVVEAVTGVISLDNAVIVAGHFRALPEDTLVLEIEPEREEFGEELTPAVEDAVARMCSTVRRLVEGGIAGLPRAPLGGGPL